MRPEALPDEGIEGWTEASIGQGGEPGRQFFLPEGGRKEEGVA